jgi:hypothetical protein
MKYILFFLLLQSTNVFAKMDSCKNKNADIFLKETTSFIDSIKSGNDIGNGLYTVYVAYLYHVNKPDFCFTLGYILNSYEFNIIDADYYITVDSEIVLITTEGKTPDLFLINELKRLNVQQFDSFDYSKQVRIVQKLYPKDVGSITYEPPGITVSIKDCLIDKKVYKSATDIPEKMSVYHSFPKANPKLIYSPPKKDK